MIAPTASDIGRAVVYRPRHGALEQGVITSFNAHCVFVRYGSDMHSMGTNPADLEWVSPAPTVDSSTLPENAFGTEQGHDREGRRS